MTECEYCIDGEVGFPPDAEECPVCKGSGVAPEPKPRFVPDTRAEQRGER